MNCASAWRISKVCWKDCARPSPDGPRPAKAMMEEKYPEDTTLYSFMSTGGLKPSP